MSNHVVPPVIEKPKTAIGIGKREFAIFAVGGLISLLFFFLPISNIAVRVGLGVLGILTTAALALGRDPRTGQTIEKIISTRFGFSRRTKIHRRGAMNVEASPTVEPVVQFSPPPTATQDSEPPVMPEMFQDEPVLTMKALPLGLTLLAEIVSLSFLAGLIAWIWLGGLQQLMYYLPKMSWN